MAQDITRNDKLRDAFLVLGSQYYALARYCAENFYLPITATLFHHAIEMLLKGYLTKYKTSKELKTVRHNLVALWEIYKDNSTEESLSRFDYTITQLDRVELLRYPDSMVDDGFILNVSLNPHQPTTEFPNPNKLPQYSVQVLKLDEIAATIYKSCQVASAPYFKDAPTELKYTLPPSILPNESK
jgi:hypothetical protein